MDFVCFIVLWFISLFILILSINTSDMSCKILQFEYWISSHLDNSSSRFYSENNSDTYSNLPITPFWNLGTRVWKGVQHTSWSRSPFWHLIGLDLMSGVPGVTSVNFPHLTTRYTLFDPTTGEFIRWIDVDKGIRLNWELFDAIPWRLNPDEYPNQYITPWHFNTHQDNES